jgi:hypothetical protein
MRAIDRILIIVAMVLFGHALVDAARVQWLRLTAKPPAPAPAPQVEDQPLPRRLAPGLARLPPPSSQDPWFSVAPTQVRRPHQRSVGTAFAVGGEGTWLTARHVIDGCSTVQMRRGGAFQPVEVVFSHESADIAVLRAQGGGPPLPVTAGPLGLGENGFGFGIAGEGGPSAIHAALLGRARAMQSGRMSGMTEVTVWAERAWIPPGERWIGGMSGGPLLVGEGAVAGVMSVASQRRGRIFTVAPETIVATMRDARLRFTPPSAAPVATSPDSLEQSRAALLNRRSVVQLLCTA